MNRVIYIIFLLVYLSLFALLLVPVIMGNETLEENLAGLIALTASLIFLVGYTYFVYRKNKRIIALLDHQCNPDAFIEQTQRLYDKLKKKGPIPYVLLQRLNLGAGLCAAGRLDEALSVMRFDVALIKSDRLGRLLRFMYHQNHFACFISFRMLDQARDALLWLSDAVKAERDGKLLERMRRWYKNDYYRYEIENGRFDGAETVFQEMFDRADTNYHRVIAMYTLALVHEHFGQMDKAREAFEYVVAQGNKLHCVIFAKERLSSIGTE